MWLIMAFLSALFAGLTTITENGKSKLKNTLKKFILQFDSDTNVSPIAAFFLNYFTEEERQELLQNLSLIIMLNRADDLRVSRKIIGSVSVRLALWNPP